MVADFKRRHRGGDVDPSELMTMYNSVDKFAGNYNRFSCDRSSPASIVDQMTNCLKKAHEKGYFIPWQFVSCDYGVTGLTSGRHGYAAHKRLIANQQLPLEITLNDDFSRASRESIEWWKLAALSKRLGKNMLGASDGFDLNDPNSDVMITIYILLSRLFIKQLRQKVKRGMEGGHRRRHVLGRLPLGFTKRVKRDEDGAVVRDADGDPVSEICVDPRTKKLVRAIYRLFVVKKWSAYRTAKYLNKRAADDWDGWTESAVKKTLYNPANIGVFIWNRWTQIFDFEKQSFVRVENPRKEWLKHSDRKLGIVPFRYYMAARRRLAAARRGPRTRKSRNELSATTLFSSALFCGYCAAELRLIRSAGPYKQMGCLNGPPHNSGRKLESSKSARVIEKCLLDYIFEAILSASKLKELVVRANTFLEQQSRKPQRSTSPLQAKIATANRKVDKLVRQIEDEEDKTLCKAYHRRVTALQKEVNEMTCQLAEIRRQNAAPPPPLDLGRVKEYLADARSILNQEIPAAAEALRALTGPITISQQSIPGRKTGARWIATFQPDVVKFLRHLTRDRNYPDCITLEFPGQHT